MLPILSLIVVLVLSMLVTRVASVALVHTGLSRETARFQARSALTGVGFTTSEAETIVGHPVRRRIVGWLMLAGNVGIVAATSSLLVSSFDIGSGQEGAWLKAGSLAAGVAAVALIARSAWLDRIMCRWISLALNRWTTVDARDFARLLHLREDYGISELRVQAEDWLAGQTLADVRLAEEGLIVLGIECPGGNFIGAPAADTGLRAGDTVILFGRTPRIAELDQRAADAAEGLHTAAAQEQAEISRRERSKANR